MRILYGINMDFENRMIFDDSTNYETSFKVLDAYDYTSISTIDVKRNICDISVSNDGSLIALVENQPAYDSKQETFVKIYAVGVKKNEQQDEVREAAEAIVAGTITAGRNGSDAIVMGENRARRRRRINSVINQNPNPNSNMIADNVEAAGERVAGGDGGERGVVANNGGGGSGGGGGGGNVAGNINNVTNNNVAVNGVNNDAVAAAAGDRSADNDVVVLRLRDLDILNGDNNEASNRAARQRRQREQRRRWARLEREAIQGFDVIWFGGANAAAGAALGGNSARLRQRTRSIHNVHSVNVAAAAAAAAAAEAEPAAAPAAAAIAAAAVARTSRAGIGNQMMAAATNPYRRLAHLRTGRRSALLPNDELQMQLLPAPTQSQRIVMPRPRAYNTISVRRPPAVGAAAAAASAARANPPAVAHSPIIAAGRRWPNDIDIEILQELDQLANNLLSMLAGR